MGALRTERNGEQYISCLFIERLKKGKETQLPNDLGVVFLQDGEVFLFLLLFLCVSFCSKREVEKGEKKPNSQTIWDLGVLYLVEFDRWD